MADKKRSRGSDSAAQDEREAVLTAEEEAHPDLYEAEVERYSEVLADDLKDAFKRYGFTLFHSLPAKTQVELSEKLGIVPRDAVDLFNLASAAIEREDYPAAQQYLQKALKQDDSFSDAVYNLALCAEKLNHKADAVKQWKRYLELCEEDEAKREVEAHLAELTA
jgi:tetratricopeptide (TPR) repeat protein